MNAMRLLAAGMMVCVLTGSARTEDKKPDNAKLIVGKWEVTKADKELPVGTVLELGKDGKGKITAKRGGRDDVLEFLYKVEGRGTQGMATLRAGDDFNVAGPLGVGFKLKPEWKNIVVLGRGVGLATLAPLSQLAAEHGVGVTAILSARNAKVVMSKDLFESLGARTISVVDSDGSSAVENVEQILEKLVAEGKADAFFTCGSNRLLKLMQRLGKAHGIPGQIAMEQIMACGLGPCYVCVKTFEVKGEKVLRRVCIEGPVFDLQEAVGW